MATPDLPEAAEPSYALAAFEGMAGNPTIPPRDRLAMALQVIDRLHAQINDLHQQVAAERTRVLGEVQAALRDDSAFWAWNDTRKKTGGTYAWIAADYLADTLGAGGDGEG